MPADDPKPAAKRHLPILQAPRDPPSPPPAAPEEEDRPPWRRVALGAAATFLVWLPLSALVETLVRRLLVVDDLAAAAPSAGAILVAAHAFAFFLGAFAGGAVPARIGADRPRREGALAGATAALLAWLIALAQGAAGGALVWALLLVILVTLGAAAGTLGARLVQRLRR